SEVEKQPGHRQRPGLRLLPEGRRLRLERGARSGPSKRSLKRLSLGRPTSPKSLPPRKNLPPLGRRVVLALRFSLDGFLHAVPPHPVRIPAQPCACESTPIARGAGEILVGRARYPVDDRKSLDSFSLHL